MFWRLAMLITKPHPTHPTRKARNQITKDTKPPITTHPTRKARNQITKDTKPPITTHPTRKARNQITKDTKPPITTHPTRKARNQITKDTKPPITTHPTRKARNQITKDTKPPITTHPTRKARNPSAQPPGVVWGGVVWCLSCLFVPFVIQTLHAAQPYQPVQPDPVLELRRWRSFPELKGLGLRCMVEDKDGTMWFGLNREVRRYDGTNWTVYTPEDGWLGTLVSVLCAARDGSVYAGTERGISRFRGGEWRRVFPLKGDLEWPIFDLVEASDGSIWAATGWGALHMGQEGATLYTDRGNGAAIRVFAPDVRVSIVPDKAAPAYSWHKALRVGIMVAEQGLIWALASGGREEAAGIRLGDRIIAVDGEPEVSMDRLNGPAGSSVTLTVQREGRSEPFEVAVTREQVEGTYRNFWVYDVYEDREGAMWFGVEQGGIVRYDIRRAESDDTTAWQLYTEKDGLDIGRWPRILQTRDGTIWTVSRHGLRGVNRFDGKGWTTFRLRAQGGSDSNPSILETEDGTLWIGGQGYMHALRTGVWSVYRASDVPIPGNYIIGLLEASDGALWIAGEGQEVVRLDYGTSRWTAYEGLNFQCETPDGAQWFLSQDHKVVAYDGSMWMRYGIEDGLMDAPVVLIATRKGVLWAAGSHDTTAATGRFDGKRWSLKTHPELSRRIDRRAVYESSDGALWFGTGGIAIPGHLGGVLRFDGKTWTHYAPPEAPKDYVYGIGQTADGDLWFSASFDLHRFDGQTWTVVTEPEEFTTTPSIDVVYATPKGDLWVGTRTHGAFQFDGKAWTRYGVRDGLVDDVILSILQTDDGSVWVGTRKGISRFDGRTWTTYALPQGLHVGEGGSLRQSRDGALWINTFIGSAAVRKAVAVRYMPETDPPETEITLSLSEVSQPGNTTLAWKGADLWRSTLDEDLQYAYRLDQDAWSPFSGEKSRIFQVLPSGKHIFQVKARDRDFNVDPTPAVVHFTVVPPLWQEPWFAGLMVVLLGAIGLQTGRVIRRDRKLQETNTALSLANKDLFELNRELQQKTEDQEETLHQLRESEVRFRSIVENANDIIYALTPEGVFSYVSPEKLTARQQVAAPVRSPKRVPFCADS